ncbi:MAG: response regulator [Deltaproteobacteria bacterium]|nr:response regulator [Deltaproteobacteria bacterium]
MALGKQKPAKLGLIARVRSALGRMRVRMVGQKSTLEALASVVRYRDLEKVIRAFPDRRALALNVANAAGVREDDLMQGVAQKLGLPYLSRVEAVDFEGCGAGVPFSEYWSCGAIPLMAHGILSGLICAEPELVIKLQNKLGGVALYLACWSKIAVALDQSEQRLQGSEAQRQKAAEQERLRRAATQALALIVEEARSYQAAVLTIKRSQERLFYEFETSQAEQARGEVHALLSEPLCALLGQNEQDGLDLQLSNHAYGRLYVKIEALEGGLGFRVAWEENEVAADASSNQELLHSEDPRGNGLVLLPGVASRVAAPAAAVAKLKGRHPSSGVPKHANKKRSGARVLLIDDNQVFLGVVQRFLMRNGVQATLESNAQSALTLLKGGGFRPELIVCDLHMPGLNGADFVRELKRVESLSEISVIMLTSDRDLEAELEMVKIGVDAFITKDQDPRLLCAQVERLLKRTQVGSGGRVTA